MRHVILPINKKTTLLFFLIIFLSFLDGIIAQVIWTKKADFKGSIRHWAAAFAIGTKGYVGSGACATAPFQATDFWEYDQVTDTWTQVASMGGVGRYLAAGMTIGNKGYIFAGRAGGQTQDLWEYTPATNTWAQKKSFPGSSRRSAIAFGIGNKGYCGTGVPAIAWDFYEYDPVADSWTQKANYPAGGGFAVSNAACFVLGNKGYVGTGCNGSNNDHWNQEFYEYDPVANKWTKKADFGGGARAYTIGFALPECNKGYIGTGRDGTSLYNDIWEYDPMVDKWTQVPTAPANFWREGAVAITIGDKAYIGTGGNGSSAIFNDWWEFSNNCNTCDTSKLTVSFVSDTVCLGSATTFTNKSTTDPSIGNIKTNDWTFGDNTTSTLTNPTHTYATSGTFTAILTVSTDSGCTKTYSKTVIVRPLPVVSAGNDVTICKGNSTTLKPTTGLSTYQWTPSTGLNNPNIEQAIASPTTTTDYILLATDANGCSNRDTVKITVDAVTVTAVADISLCKGTDTVISAIVVPSTGTLTYKWTPNTAISSTSINSPRVNPSSTTTYTITVTNANNCTATDSVKVSVYTTAVPVSAGPDLSVCRQDSIQLNLSGTGSIKWTPSAGLSNDTIANPIAKPASTTTYIVTVTGGCSGSGSDTITVNVNTPVAADAGTNANICSGTSTTLSPTTGLKTYTWKPSTGLSNDTIANPVASPTASTTYTLSATDQNGCSSTDTVRIGVNALPAVSVSGAATICLGSTTTLTANGSGGVTKYTWVPSTSPDTGSSVQATPTQEGVNYYRVIGENACGSDTDSVAITVLSSPIVNAGNDTAICNKQSVQLNPSITGNAVSYSWTPSSGISDTAVAAPIASPSQATSYIITASNGTCSSSDTITVSVYALNAGFTATPDKGSAPLPVSFINTSTGADEYLWSFGETATSSLSNPTYVYSNPGTYLVTLTVSSGGCADSAKEYITVGEESVLWIPNAFTPGDVDNINNVFRVESVGITELKVMIFDRWGELIYDWTDINGGWNGNYKGGPAQEGVYVYIVKATGIDNQIYQKTGHVTLLRQTY